MLKKTVTMATLFLVAISFNTYSNSQSTAGNLIVKDTKPLLSHRITETLWGQTQEKPVYLYTLTNKNNMTVKVSNWGGYVQSISTPDRLGNVEDVLIGYDTWEEYYNDCCYSGPIVGRFGNRIAQGKFTIDGTTFSVTRNNGGANNDVNQLHGGLKGLHKRLWQSRITNEGVELSYLSVDKEEGYPGNLNIKVTYSLNDNNELSIAYQATTDKKTPINLTSHTYFNLSGNAKRNIENHQLMIAADLITPVDEFLIPTGELQSVFNTPFDFRKAKAIGDDIRSKNTQLKLGGGEDKEFGGYDHNWVFSQFDGTLKVQAYLYEPISGRFMEILTEEPAIQFYSGNFMDGKVKGKNGKLVKHRDGLALEPQHYPDSPNQTSFPNTILSPGDVYQTRSIYRFSVK